MVALQIISKMLATQSVSIVDDNLIPVEAFVGYEDEIDFILGHFDKYGNTPDKATFLSKFPDIELVEVSESDVYLVDAIREEYLYYKSVPVVQKVAELLKTDANAAAEYMIDAVRDLQPTYQLGGTDIIADAQERYDQYVQRRKNPNEWHFTSGFEELDDLIHGLQRGEELLVLFARINQGKSWVLEKMCTHVWQLGFNVGLFSPEMSASSIGYRFDTLNKNFSNKQLMYGKTEVENYDDYVKGLAKNKNKFIVATPGDFNRVITVSKLRNWVQQYDLDLLAIDGITYLTDERYRKGDNKTAALTNISEDLMSLSIELQIPIIVVVQANRGGVNDVGDNPDLEHIKDSDGIGANASKVISIRQTKEKNLVMQVKKQRNGPVGDKLMYRWDIDLGEFEFMQNSGNEDDEDEEPRKKTRKEKKQATDEF